MPLTRYGTVRDQLLRESLPSVFAPVVLRDQGSSYVPISISERLVQCIWYDQRLRRDPLQTVDGCTVRVIFQGWWNLEAGPDFRHATVQIGNEPERSGDIEVHLRADDWFQHGHDRDPHYGDVVLHVVLWQAGSTRAPRTAHGIILPQLVIEHQLDAPLEALSDEIDLEAYPHNVTGHGGRCASVLPALVPAPNIGDLLDEAGDERFAGKIRRFTRWIRRAGPEQAFYEGWMEALGYKGNKTGFRRLAQRLPLAELLPHRATLAPRLFGTANFLPTDTAPVRDPASPPYAQRLWRTWWKLRPQHMDRVLPASTWRFHGIRPANHPHRRLGAAVALLKKHPALLEKVIGAVESGGDPARFFASVRDDYWSRHFTLGGRTQSRAAELIGENRAQEIVSNVVLPFVAAMAQDRQDDDLYEKARSRYRALRASPSHSLLRLAAGQLFGSPAKARPFLKSCRRQQGLIQIFQDFCINDKSACQQCQFPEMARRWKAGGPAE